MKVDIGWKINIHTSIQMVNKYTLGIVITANRLLRKRGGLLYIIQ